MAAGLLVQSGSPRFPRLTVQYHLVYDAAAVPFRFPREALVAGIPLLLGLLIVRSPRAWFSAYPPRVGRLFGALVAGVSALVLLGVPLVAYSAHAELQDALARHTYTVVEGVVSHVLPGHPDGHPLERFTVAGHEYVYSPYTAPGFNQIAAAGGPIRAGRQVRVADVEGNIARLEVAP